ncbi:MAG TPA: two-component regulator propeller domain-containing protein, partial [Panacibacter sp.]|nr:two-component regulator propeller domain-containing protein [Panacibacter sp.]
MHIPPVIKTTTSFLLIFIFYFNAGAQHYNSYQYFTTKEGLPTNFIYKCVQDKRGLLWVCTDAGVLRFDGKNFELYTNKDGLPDVEVLEIIMDSSGTIWANTFQHDPGYYNPLTNRFINAKEDTALAAIKDASLTRCFALKYGGVAFVNRMGTYFFGRKPAFLKVPTPPKFCIENKKDEFWIGTSRIIYQYSANRLIDSLLLDSAMNNIDPSVKISGNNIYVAEKNDTVLKCYNNIDFKNKKFSITKTAFPTPIILFNITGNYACVCLQSGE